MVATWSRLLPAAVLVVLSTATAAASPAITERSAYLRAGPGTSYRIVGMLPRGAAIDVAGCTGGWCEVPWGGGRTYVAQSLLALQGTAPAVIVAPGQPYGAAFDPPYESDDYPGFDFPGTAYAPATSSYAPTAGIGAPAAGTAALPRWSHRRWSAWRHRYGRAWIQRPYAPSTNALAPGATGAGALGAAAPGGERSTFGRVDDGRLVPTARGAIEGGRPTVGSASPDAFPPVPPLPIPTASTSPGSAAVAPARPPIRGDR
jgi:hypothetical protein